MEFRILGPLEILDGERVVPLGGSKRRAAAAALLLHPNRVVAFDQLIAFVWGDDPPAAALGSLQNHCAVICQLNKSRTKQSMRPSRLGRRQHGWPAL